MRILQITTQRDNWNHCTELFTDINIVLKLQLFFYNRRYLQQISCTCFVFLYSYLLQLFFTIVIFDKYLNVDDFLVPMKITIFRVSGMVFSTTVDDGGPVRECDVSHYVFQIVNVRIRPTKPSKAFKSFSTSFAASKCPPSSSFQHVDAT